MADNSRLIHLLPLPHLVVGATVIVGEDTAVEEDVAVALQDLILEVEGTEAVVAEVETDSLSLLRVVEKGDISPNRMLAGMTMAVQEEAAAVAVADTVVIADVARAMEEVDTEEGDMEAEAAVPPVEMSVGSTVTCAPTSALRSSYSTGKSSRSLA